MRALVLLSAAYDGDEWWKERRGTIEVTCRIEVAAAGHSWDDIRAANRGARQHACDSEKSTELRLSPRRQETNSRGESEFGAGVRCD